ncbi:MAG: Chorismate mutase type [Miltoncostaeaceae bacterium]|jgi:chorismate mutase|nr:Chorismate mutase type [Miltoncostaeaceae bacterium]
MSSQPTPDTAARDAVVRQMRDAIIDNDLKLVQAVNQRLDLVSRLRAYKQSQGLEFVDQQREDWMHGYLQGANRGPLSAQGLRELYDHLLELTKRETAAPA